MVSGVEFEKAKFTAVISDLHVCEAEPIHSKFPLWKKFKTKQFFFDSIFSDFLKHIEEKAQGESVELVLNGDIFDFDSMLSLPENPIFRVSWLERRSGLKPVEERSHFKMTVIIKDHPEFFSALGEFIKRKNKVVFVIGNHDIELHYGSVQEEILSALGLTYQERDRVRFCEWFYISNKDTLIEHGNQYDPYCLCEDPVNPYIMGYNYKAVRIPFGNLASRYIINKMGFFNPHVDSNYIMSLKEYVFFFLKYMARAQPLLILTWFWGSVLTLVHSFTDKLRSPMRDPLKVEDRVNRIAEKANAEPRMVRELKELFPEPAASNPVLLARELWLDRAFMILITFYVLFLLFLFIKQVYSLSFFWAFIPLFLLLPFFLFYSQSVTSHVSSYKEPNEKILSVSGQITKTNRIVYGHTHILRHEVIGAIEHLNSGCWSPAFLDVECTKPLDQRAFVWIYTDIENESRKAELLKFSDGSSSPLFHFMAKDRSQA